MCVFKGFIVRPKYYNLKLEIVYIFFLQLSLSAYCQKETGSFVTFILVYPVK